MKENNLLISNNLNIKYENKIDNEKRNEENSFLNGIKLLGNFAVGS